MTGDTASVIYSSSNQNQGKLKGWQESCEVGDEQHLVLLIIFSQASELTDRTAISRLEVEEAALLESLQTWLPKHLIDLREQKHSIINPTPQLES